MPEIRSTDGRYLAVQQDDGNFVVYLTATMAPVWDRWSAEAGAALPAPVTERPPLPLPIPESSGAPIRITDERDGKLVPRMYSYWSNAVVLANAIILFVGHADGHPRFFAVNVNDATVKRLGPMLPYTGTSEGWYWDEAGWIYLIDGPRLRHVNPFTGSDHVSLDISNSHPGCDLWQAHSSDDGQVHSATVRRIVSDGPYPKIGTIVEWHGQRAYFPAKGTLDESQITPDGAFLVIKEDDDNRIITLATRDTRLIRNADGAVGHSDCGPGILVGEDDQRGACVLWDLTKPVTPERRRTLFSTWNMGHVSVRGGRCLLSDVTHISLVELDGSGVTPLFEHGMTGSDYDHQVQANLDPTGQVFCYLSNAAGRLDAYVGVLS